MGLFDWRKTKKGAEEPKKTQKTGSKPAKVEVDKQKADAASGRSMKDLYAPKAVASSASGPAKKEEAKKRGYAYRVIIKPLITEKAANLGTDNKYVFEVALNVNKIEVALAVHELYGVKPVSVNIVKVGGKGVRHGRIKGRRKDWKKAIVTLPAGRTINIYEGV